MKTAESCITGREMTSLTAVPSQLRPMWHSRPGSRKAVELLSQNYCPFDVKQFDEQKGYVRCVGRRKALCGNREEEYEKQPEGDVHPGVAPPECPAASDRHSRPEERKNPQHSLCEKESVRGIDQDPGHVDYRRLLRNCRRVVDYRRREKRIVSQH